MPRRLFQRLRPIAARLRERWYFKALGPRLTDPRLWSVNRRAITSAFGAGIAICFVPIPIHLPLGLIAAMVWRLNVPAMIGTLLLMNPLTVVPVYYAAYRVGALLLGLPPGGFHFALDWNWLQTGLGAFWKPFLLGCLVCGVLGGYLAYRVLELIWLRSTVNRLNARRSGIRE
jgi:uncharacterized protein